LLFRIALSSAECYWKRY